MTYKLLFIYICISFTTCLFAQPVVQPDGGGPYSMQPGIKDDMTPQQKATIVQMLQTNEATLRLKGLLPATNQPMVTGFQWPISQPTGFNDNGYYGISNYVDEDASASYLDFNCGNRTYDGHQGTDIFIFPFPWQKMAQNAVQIIAAAPGTIIGKTDGNTDTSCAGCVACNWNAVYVMQADGSVTWYGHMKKNSQTAKAVGQTVALGEFLGIVGSSGSSTAPHCHFQVWTNSSYTQLIDPWAGSCNGFNGLTSWWAIQQPYTVSTLLKIMTHYPPPSMTGCKSGESVNSKVNFVNGETIYLASYFRDQQSGQHSVNTIYRPDSTVFFTWTYNFNAYYNASWYYFTRVLPNPAPTGMWRYEVVYNGQPPLTTYFGVNELGYTFTGNGNWNIASNWNNNTIPPAVLPAGSEILINPIAGGECILNVSQTVSNGAKITVISGKKLTIPGNLIIQ